MNDPARSSRKAVMTMILLNGFATPLMLSAVNVALPAIANDLSLSATQLSWVPMAYLTASAMFVLVFGKLADLVGRQRLFLAGSFCVILSSLLTSTATTPILLLSGRFLQGISAAMLYATQIAIVSSVYPARERGKAIGMVISVIYIGLAAGPSLGGLVTDWLGWRANFLLHIPLACAALVIGLIQLRGEAMTNLEQVPARPAARVIGSVDIKGALLYSPSIFLLCLGVTQLPELRGFLLLLMSAGGMFVFTRHALTIENPIWDIRLFFSNRLFTLSCAAALTMYTATYANVVLLSLYLQHLQALSASAAGLIMMIQPLTMAALSPLTGRLSDRFEPRTMATAGMLLAFLGLTLLSSLDQQSRLSLVALALLCTGTGFSLFSPPNANAMMGSVDSKDFGSASGAIATTRVLGQLLSMVLVALIMTLTLGSQLIAPENYHLLDSAITTSFLIFALVLVPGILLSAVRGRTHHSV